MYFTIFFLVLASFITGYVVGLVQKGIHVNINQKQDIPTEFNPSLASELPPEIQHYYHETKGYNKF